MYDGDVTRDSGHPDYETPQTAMSGKEKARARANLLLPGALMVFPGVFCMLPGAMMTDTPGSENVLIVRVMQWMMLLVPAVGIVSLILSWVVSEMLGDGWLRLSGIVCAVYFLVFLVIYVVGSVTANM